MPLNRSNLRSEGFSVFIQYVDIDQGDDLLETKIVSRVEFVIKMIFRLTKRLK